ncbi:MAG: response regulator [Chthonomonadales bacterium]|nr:response regulator [Chthonomonadales bacterium]
MTSETMISSSALICEDDGLQVVAIRTALIKAGYQVIGEATEGRQAVEMAKDLKPDLVLMDIKMPGLISGIAAVREILQALPMPIIMLTAYSDDELIDAAIDAGACAYLVKPVTSEQLLPAIKTAMARFHDLQEAIHASTEMNEALETRKLVERANGIYREQKQLSEADAFRALQKISRDKSQTMKQTAVEIIRMIE